MDAPVGRTPRPSPTQRPRPSHYNPQTFQPLSGTFPPPFSPISHGLLSRCVQVEQALYGSSGGGAIYRLLQRESMSSCPMVLRKGSILVGHVTAQEYEFIVKELEVRPHAAARFPA